MLFQDSYVFVSKTKNIPQKGLIIIFKDWNIFLRELKIRIFKWIKNSNIFESNIYIRFEYLRIKI